MLGRSHRVCHHLHLSLQSGSDPVLERMNHGGYTGQFIRVRLPRERAQLGDLVRVALFPSGRGQLTGQIFPVTTLTNWHTISHY